jgi:hypothetical protein
LAPSDVAAVIEDEYQKQQAHCWRGWTVMNRWRPSLVARWLACAMDKMSFRRNPARNIVMTYAQIRAILRKHGGEATCS